MALRLVWQTRTSAYQLPFLCSFKWMISGVAQTEVRYLQEYTVRENVGCRFVFVIIDCAGNSALVAGRTLSLNHVL